MIIHADNREEYKHKRKKKLQKKVELKRKKRNPLTQSLHELGHPVIEPKEKGGAKNLLKEIGEIDYEEL